MRKKTKNQDKVNKKKGNQRVKSGEKDRDNDLLKKLATQHYNKRSRTSLIPNHFKDEEKDEIKSSFDIDHNEGNCPNNVSNGEPDLPEWFEDLTADNEAAFKELFDMLDSAKTGTLNAENLFEGLQRVDSGITREEVEAVMQKLDKDGNGEIDFDEFLVHMTTGDLLASGQDGSKKGFSRRQRLFYTAITQYSMKHKIEQERKRQPHVIGHYAAGVRIVGLTDKQLARQMKKLQKTAKKHDSPYARPLPFVTLGPCKEFNKKSRFEISTKRTEITPRDTRSQQRNISQTSAMELGPEETIDAWKHRWKFFATRDSVVGKTDELLDSIRAAGLKNTLILPEYSSATEQNTATRVVPPEFRSATQQRTSLQVKDHFPNKSKRKSVAIGKGVIPHVGNSRVPLPVLKIKYTGHRPTIDDLPNIREMAKAEMDVYYEKLRVASVKNAYEHWDKLYADTIRPKKLLENFRIVYRAYSPHKEDEAFVVCPWMRGPYSYFKRKVDTCVRPFSAGR